MKRFILYIGIAAIFATSCQKDLQEGISAPVDYGEAVAVKLDYIVDGIGAGTAEAQTRASNGTADDVVSSEVRNLWIIQFDGTEDTSEAIVAHYVSALSATANSVTLLPLGRATTVVAVANTYNPDLIPMPLRMTISEFKALHRTIVTNTLETGAYWGDGVVSYGGDNNPYFLLNDSQDVTVLSDGSVTYEVDVADGDVNADEEDTNTDEAVGESLSFALKRNVAKIIVTLKNNWEGADMHSVTINGVATESYFYTNRDDSDPLTAPFPSTNVATMRYATHSVVDQANETIIFYVPVNMQGVNESATEKTKPYYAPISASYLSILLSEKDVESSEIEYRIYLGENLSTNYNLEPNKEYEYTISFSASGIAEDDYRVNEIGVIDYTTSESANCYIINPSQEVGRVYYLPIEDRINEFWGDYAGIGDKIEASTDWEIEPLWYDKNSGESSIPEDLTLEKVVRNGEHAIKVTVPQNFTYYTNLIVAVKIEDEIVWSWHLWITDYNPDSRDYAVIEGQYLYPVDGGYIERYMDNSANTNVTGNIWGEGGIYAEMYIMDRNLGALDATRYGQGGNSDKAAGALFYQFGRKDPFPGGSGYLFDDDAAAFSPTIEAGFVDFDYTVNHPAIFITSSSNWCEEIVSSNYRYLWNDFQCLNPTVDNTGASIEVKESTGRRKSIFDPSPLGWRLPISDVWNHFDETSFLTSIYAEQEHQNNRTYTLTDALYVANGYRDAETGTYKVGGTLYNGFIWSASPNIYLNASVAQFLTFNSTEVIYNSKDRPRANAFNVRCVKDNLIYD